ncbi:Cadherin-7 [Liparis tanakae]|uniref:Cadherin-7 n=1 Tax=Liparis tanakae TaxID=230148 RepID=A0A4Z2GSG8_9TELE|nr:Cadherin-7 [Liparis tanakae]
MVVQVAATDADDPTYGNSARVVYSIIHGQPYFSVEPKTGASGPSRSAAPSFTIITDILVAVATECGGGPRYIFTAGSLAAAPPRLAGFSRRSLARKLKNTGRPVGFILLRLGSSAYTRRDFLRTEFTNR